MGQPSTTDTLTLGLSEDAYKGDAQLPSRWTACRLAPPSTVNFAKGQAEQAAAELDGVTT